MIRNETSAIKLTGRKLKAIHAVLSNDTLNEAAITVGVSRTTLHRYMHDDVFVSELKRAKRAMLNQTILKLQRGMADAARTLIEVCNDRDAPPSARVVVELLFLVF